MFTRLALAIPLLAWTASMNPAWGQPVCSPATFSGEASLEGDAPLPLLLTITCAEGSPGMLQIQALPRPIPLRTATTGADRLSVTAEFDGQPLTIEARDEGAEFTGRFTLGGSGGIIRLRRGQDGAAPVSLAAGEIDLTISVAQRRADLQALSEGIERNHANAFHSIQRGEWRRRVGAMDQRLDELPPEQLPVAFLELASLIGDGHTGVRLPTSVSRLPLVLMWFGGDLRVVRADLENADLLGARITGFGDESLGSVSQKMARLVTRGQNRWLFQSRSQRLLRRQDVLDYLGLAAGNQVRISARHDDGRRIERTITLAANVSDPELTPVGGTLPKYQTRAGQPLWWERIAPDTVYVGFQSYEELRTRSAALLAELDRDRPRRVVLDLRDNPGGDFTVFRESLLAGIHARPWLNRRNRLYVIINRGIFSAAMVNAVDLLTRTRATVVGEPIGERPNEYAEVRFFNLPNSHITYGVSTEYYRFLPGNPEAVEPRISVPARWQDFAAGRDTALQWILARPARP